MPTMPPTFRPHGQRTEAERRREYDDRRGKTSERGYGWRWQQARLEQLRAFPLCAMCLRKDRVTPATVVDHIVPHGGDERLFWNRRNWQSLCKPHHDSEKQRDERTFSPEVKERRMPSRLRASRIPLTIVCGAAGSGKSTYVRERAGPNDIVIDLDAVMADLSGGDIHQAKVGWLESGLDERNRRLAGLASDRVHDRAWFVVAAPDSRDRDLWARRLGAQQIVVIDTPLDECLRRIAADPTRAGREGPMAEWARAWWETYEITLPL